MVACNLTYTFLQILRDYLQFQHNPKTLNLLNIQDHELTAVAHIELYHNVMILKVLTTSKAYRNQGVARKLLQHTEHLAQKLGCDMIYAFTRYGANYLECAGFEQTIRSRLPLQLVDYMTNHQLNHSTIMKRKVELSKKHLMRQEQKALQTQMPLSHLVA